VDVGIPTYGQPKFLADAIESVLAQTFESWQLTVSENGPRSPEVAAIIKPYLSDPRVRYAATGRNIGAAGNWTRLIQTGRAPYVALLNDDDLWEPGFLARRVAFLEAHLSCGLVFSSSDFIDTAGRVIHRFDSHLTEGVQERKAFLRRLYVGNIISSTSALVRRASYEAVGPAFNGSLLFADHEMWLRIASRFDVGFLADSDARYRLHPLQTTQRLRRHMGEHRLRVLEAAESFLPRDVPRQMRRRATYIALARSFVDALARGELRESAVHLGRALRLYPLGPLDPKVALQVIRSGFSSARRIVISGGRSSSRRRGGSDRAESSAQVVPEPDREPHDAEGRIHPLGRGKD
jgi:glycosyltransferase involved in cell wall biosynthesis